MLVVPFSFDFFTGYVERQAKAKTTAIQKPLYDWDWRTASRVIDTMPLKRQQPQHLPKAFHLSVPTSTSVGPGTLICTHIRMRQTTKANHVSKSHEGTGVLLRLWPISWGSVRKGTQVRIVLDNQVWRSISHHETGQYRHLRITHLYKKSPYEDRKKERQDRPGKKGNQSCRAC